jgi:hypothetical protein
LLLFQKGYDSLMDLYLTVNDNVWEKLYEQAKQSRIKKAAERAARKNEAGESEPTQLTKVGVRVANYTQEQIPLLWLKSEKGDPLSLMGGAPSLDQGGAGPGSCCAPMAGVGARIIVEWRFGKKLGDSKEVLKQLVTLTGKEPSDPRDHTYVVVRFFPDNRVEAELIPGAEFRKENPRVDRLFFSESDSTFNGKGRID